MSDIIKQEKIQIMYDRVRYNEYKEDLFYCLQGGLLEEFLRIKTILLEDEYDEEGQKRMFTEYQRFKKMEIFTNPEDIASLRYYCKFQIGKLLPVDPALLPPFPGVCVVEITPKFWDDLFMQKCFRYFAQGTKDPFDEKEDKEDQKAKRLRYNIDSHIRGGDIMVTMPVASYKLIRDDLIALGVKETPWVRRKVNFEENVGV